MHKLLNKKLYIKPNIHTGIENKPTNNIDVEHAKTTIVHHHKRNKEINKVINRNPKIANLFGMGKDINLPLFTG